MSRGKIYGVGLGPGEPDLMSVRADRLVRHARFVAYFRKKGRPGQARRIVEGRLHPDVQECPMEYPVTTEVPISDPRYNQVLAKFYAECAARLVAVSEGGDDVVVLCEGDPFFYGSFMHLHTRLAERAPVEVVPATTGMSGAWTAVGMPFTWGDDVLTVLMGTLPEVELQRRMAETDALVVMKLGRHFEKVCRALKNAGKHSEAFLVEYATMPNQKVHALSDVDGDTVPYFSIILVPGKGRRP